MCFITTIARNPQKSYSSSYGPYIISRNPQKNPSLTLEASASSFVFGAGSGHRSRRAAKARCSGRWTDGDWVLLDGTLNYRGLNIMI